MTCVTYSSPSLLKQFPYSSRNSRITFHISDVLKTFLLIATMMIISTKTNEMANLSHGVPMELFTTKPVGPVAPEATWRT